MDMTSNLSTNKNMIHVSNSWRKISSSGNKSFSSLSNHFIAGKLDILITTDTENFWIQFLLHGSI